MAETESELEPDSSTEEAHEQGNLSDEERVEHIKQKLKKWQLGAAICLLLCFVLLGLAITKFLVGASIGSEELISLEMLPDNRANHLISTVKKARQDASKIEEKLETILASEDAIAVLTDAPKTMQVIVENEKQFLESIDSYGDAVQTMTVLIGGAKEWNYGFQGTLHVFEKRSRARVERMENMVAGFPLRESK